MSSSLKVSLLDYGAGNVRSVRNAIQAAGYEVQDIETPDQIAQADVIVFPGVGSFGSAMRVLHEKGFYEPLRTYLQDQTRPFLGICLGMQTLFESSSEQLEHANTTSATASTANTPIKGLGIIPGHVISFDSQKMIVPHIGWNGRIVHQNSPVLQYIQSQEQMYFVHSYYAPITEQNKDWVLTSTTYSGQAFISAVQKGAVVATQFHPEKSGATGLKVLKGFLEAVDKGTLTTHTKPVLPVPPTDASTQLVKRIVVALDVRTNDHGDLVVTKGDQYDVRENHKEGVAEGGRGGVRNLGKPVALARRYYEEGGDEIAFLNITSFRQGVIEDMPMLHVLEEASRNIFVPLTVGGGIRSYTDPVSGQSWSALEVASRYFRAGADKVSLGSDAVYASEDYIASGYTRTGKTSIEMISHVYGVQAVVVSIDPRRVYVTSKDATTKHVVVELPAGESGPNGERFCWYQCTVKGGREARDIYAVTVAKSVEALGAGEIMLNCIDMDGQGNGFDLPLMQAVTDAISIPVIASSGAGKVEHFSEVFQKTGVQAALGAGMFHRKEVEIMAVKEHLAKEGIPARH
jgi:glutamine amidotransferase/cyclase